MPRQVKNLSELFFLDPLVVYAETVSAVSFGTLIAGASFSACLALRAPFPAILSTELDGLTVFFGYGSPSTLIFFRVAQRMPSLGKRKKKECLHLAATPLFSAGLPLVSQIFSAKPVGAGSLGTGVL